MSQAYAAARSAYFVVERGGWGSPRICCCDVSKMATGFGFRACYLATLNHMAVARRLYARNGFAPLEGPLGNTGHYGCNAWYLRALS